MAQARKPDRALPLRRFEKIRRGFFALAHRYSLVEFAKNCISVRQLAEFRSLPVFNLIIPITRGIIRSQRARRMIMFYDVIIAMVMLFSGSSVLRGWLRANPLIFVIFWAACAWLTLLAVLLALFDLVAVRAAWRREKRRLEAEYLESLKRNGPHGENTPRTRAD
jgi:hypothetical protein